MNCMCQSMKLFTSYIRYISYILFIVCIFQKLVFISWMEIKRVPWPLCSPEKQFKQAWRKLSFYSGWTNFINFQSLVVNQVVPEKSWKFRLTMSSDKTFNSEKVTNFCTVKIHSIDENVRQTGQLYWLKIDQFTDSINVK